MELGRLMCKACGRIVAKLFGEEPRKEGFGVPRRACRGCVLPVRFDPAVGPGVSA